MGKNNRKKNSRRKKTTKSSSSSAAKIDTKTVDDSTNVEDKATNEVEVKASKDATSTDMKTDNGEATTTAATATTSVSPIKPSRTKSVFSSVGSMITSPFSTVSGEFSFVVFFVHHNAQRAYTHLLTPLLL